MKLSTAAPKKSKAVQPITNTIKPAAKKTPDLAEEIEKQIAAARRKQLDETLAEYEEERKHRPY